MTARLLLLAHGATSATRRAAFTSGGESLDDATVGLSARAPRGDRALTSPALAARETAAALALDALVDDDLRDLDCGSWAGRTFAEVAAADQDAASAFLADPTFAGHGGESIASLIARIAGWMEAQRDCRGRIVAITHAAVVRAAAIAVLSAPPLAFWRIDIAPLHGLAFSSDARRWSLRGSAQAQDC